MLAQNFKTSAELHITQKVYEGLKRVLVRLETNDLVYFPRPSEAKGPNGFNMGWEMEQRSCGTVGCLAGWTAVEAGLGIWTVAEIPCLGELFYPHRHISIEYF